MALQTLAQINAMPEVGTSRIRELQWGIDWWAKCYGEAALHEKIAYEAYYDAIDNNEPKEQRKTLFTVARMFEENRKAAYHQWQECKRQYLDMLN